MKRYSIRDKKNRILWTVTVSDPLEKEIRDVIHNQVKENYMRKADAEENIRMIEDSHLIARIFADWGDRIYVTNMHISPSVNHFILDGSYDEAECIYLFYLKSILRCYGNNKFPYFQWCQILEYFLKNTIKERDRYD